MNLNIFVFEPLLQPGKIPEAPLMYCFWCVFHSAPDVVFLAITALKLLGPIAQWMVRCDWWNDVQDNVLRFFAIDHVLVSFVTIQMRFLAYNSPKLFGGRALPGPARGASALPRPSSSKTGGLLLRGGEGREGKGIGWEGRGREGRAKEGTGKEGRGKRGERRDERGGEGKREGDGPLKQISGSAPGVYSDTR